MADSILDLRVAPNSSDRVFRGPLHRFSGADGHRIKTLSFRPPAFLPIQPPVPHSRRDPTVFGTIQ